MDRQQIIAYLEKAGLELPAANLYLRLLDHGPATALQLARLTAISRTQIYRFLEQLVTFELVQQYDGTSAYLALPISQLASSIENRQQQASQLLTDLPRIQAQLQGNGKTTVKTMPGTGGINQSLWEIARYGHEYLAICPGILGSQLNRQQQLAFRHLFYGKSLQGRLLSNAQLISQSEIAPLTDELLPCRQIDTEVLAIGMETVIAGNYVWLFNDSGATAIMSQPLSVLLGQLFESYWQLAAPIDIV